MSQFYPYPNMPDQCFLAQAVAEAQVTPAIRKFQFRLGFMAPVLETKLMHHLDRTLKDEDVEVLKQDLGLSKEEIRDMMKIVAKDNQRSQSIFALARFFVVMSLALAGGGGYLHYHDNFHTASTLLVCAIVGMSIGISGLIGSVLAKCREENHHSVELKLNRRFPRLRFTISKKTVKGGCGPTETGWQLVVEKRDGETAKEEV